MNCHHNSKCVGKTLGTLSTTGTSMSSHADIGSMVTFLCCISFSSSGGISSVTMKQLLDSSVPPARNFLDLIKMDLFGLQFISFTHLVITALIVLICSILAWSASLTNKYTVILLVNFNHVRDNNTVNC